MTGTLAARPAACSPSDQYNTNDGNGAYLCNPTNNTWQAFQGASSSILPTTVVPFSASPSFNGTVTAAYSITLTGNVTSSTVTGSPVNGTLMKLHICQGAGGPWTFAFPAGFLNTTTIQTTSCTDETYSFDGTNWSQLTQPAGGGGGGGGSPGGTSGQVQTNNGIGGFGGGPQVATVATKPALPNDPVQYVSPNGNDTNDGLSWGSAKLTLTGAAQALPGGSTGVAGAGKIYVSGTYAASPTASQGFWLMGPSDPNYASPPTGWLKFSNGVNALTVECAFDNQMAAHGHQPSCTMSGGTQSGSVNPTLWLSATTGFKMLNVGFTGFLNVFAKIGIDSNNNRNGTGGTTDVTLDGVSWNHGSCRLGGGPGIDIGSNSFWIWIRNATGSGCFFGTSIIAAPGVPGLSRSGGVVTVNTTAANSIIATNGYTVTIANATDPSFNGSFLVTAVNSNTQFTYSQNGPTATSGNGLVITGESSAINIDAGGTGSGSGLIFIEDINVNNGSIRLRPGTNGGGVYVHNGSYEGDSITPKDVPGVLVTSAPLTGALDDMNVHVDNFEMSDAVVPAPAVRIDGTNIPFAVVSRVDGVLGPATFLGGTTEDQTGVSPLRSGYSGLMRNGRVIGGGIDVARRGFGPVAAISANLAAFLSASWTYGTGAGTITTGISSPDALTNAGRATSNAGLSQVAFYTLNNTPLTVGDAYIYGLWQRMNSGGTIISAPSFNLNANGFGSGDLCAATNTASGITLFREFNGDGQWIWMAGICKVSANPTNAGIQFTGQVTNPQTVDFFGPTLIKIPAGTKSDNELYEIANNLSVYASTAAAGEVSMLPNQKLREGTTTFANLGTAADGVEIFCIDCVPSSNPCVGTGTGAFAQHFGGAWVCGGGGGGGCAPGGITDALQYNGGGTCAFGGVNSPTVNGNYVVNYNVTASAAVPPTINLPGVPINAQSGTSYTYLYTDRAALVTATNAAAQTYTMVNPSGATFGFNMPYMLWNRGSASGALTENASGFTVNGGTSLLVPINWLSPHWSDGVNWTAARIPEFAAFPNCTGGGNALQFTTSTGAFSCGSASAGVSSFTGDGALLSNSLSTGAVTATLANAGAHKFWMNNTGISAAPGYQSPGKADLLGTIVYTDQANTYSTGLQDFSAATMKVPTGAGATAGASSMLIYDSTNKNMHIYANNADAINLAIAAAPTTGDLADYSVSSSNVLAHDSGIATANVVTAASAASAAKQVCVSSGASKTCSYIDMPETFYVPAANCVNATAASAWSTGATPAALCRAGTNNKDALLSPWGASDVGYLKVHLPNDWDSGSSLDISIDLTSTDTTNGHTIIMQAATACGKGDGSTTDDVAFNTAQSFGTITLNGNANRTWNATLTGLTKTGCTAGSTLWIKISRTTDTSVNVGVYGATVDVARLITVQAN